MNYVPNLIPDDKKVLPEYFTAKKQTSQQKSSATSLFSLLGALLLFVVALVAIPHPLVSLLVCMPGFVLLPYGHRWLEKKLRFHMTVVIKSATVGILLVLVIPVALHYRSVDKENEAQAKRTLETEKQASLAAAVKQHQQDDSMRLYLAAVTSFEKKGNLDKALKEVDTAAIFATTDSSKSAVTVVRSHLQKIHSITLVKKGQYLAALPELSGLLSTDPTNEELLYNRAICYSKTGDMQEAVNDLKPLLNSGNEAAEKLHDQINPVQRHVTGYVTRCMDGSTSSATGRGACSHHGGVKNWNEPIYEESRKY